jgi:hypothetical protein
MARQYPSELHLGQKIFVQLDPTAHPIAALVTKIDRDEGLIHVNPIGYKVRWAAKPRAISNGQGQYLRFNNQEFFFAENRAM